MIGLFLEEIEIGRKVDLGDYSFTDSNIASFAGRFAPVPFHVSAEVAKDGLFGKTAAAGFHICSAWMICFVITNAKARDGLAAEGKMLPELGPSPGLANVRWLQPVFAGDTVRNQATITALRELQSKPRWGLVTSLNEGFNQRGEAVLSFESKVLVAKVNALQS